MNKKILINRMIYSYKNTKMENIYLELDKEKIPFHYEEIIDKIPRIVIGPFRRMRGESYKSFKELCKKITILCDINRKTLIFSGLDADIDNTYQASLFIYNITQEECIQYNFKSRMFKYEYENYSPTPDDIQYLQKTSFQDPTTFFGLKIHKEMYKNYSKELIVKTWTPQRVESWCLPHLSF